MPEEKETLARKMNKVSDLFKNEDYEEQIKADLNNQPELKAHGIIRIEMRRYFALPNIESFRIKVDAKGKQFWIVLKPKDQFSGGRAHDKIFHMISVHNQEKKRMLFGRSIRG